LYCFFGPDPFLSPHDWPMSSSAAHVTLYFSPQPELPPHRANHSRALAASSTMLDRTPLFSSFPMHRVRSVSLSVPFPYFGIEATERSTPPLFCSSLATKSHHPPSLPSFHSWPFVHSLALETRYLCRDLDHVPPPRHCSVSATILCLFSKVTGASPP
jgi:hypothetical protein